MSDLKEIKQTILSYGLYLPFVREMVNAWASSNNRVGISFRKSLKTDHNCYGSATSEKRQKF